MIDRILKKMDEFDGSRSKMTLFSDWVKLGAISIANTMWYEEQEEQKYTRLAATYNAEELKRFCEMNGMLWAAFEREIDDYLGKLYMASGMGSKETGQFFTPFHISLLTAKMDVRERLEEIKKRGRFTMYEPSSGGGGMILAAAKALKDEGINYQTGMMVTAMDLDWTSVYMTYIQLAMAGIPARVTQGDSLAPQWEQTRPTLYTPMYVLQGGYQWTKNKIV